MDVSDFEVPPTPERLLSSVVNCVYVVLTASQSKKAFSAVSCLAFLLEYHEDDQSLCIIHFG